MLKRVVLLLSVVFAFSCGKDNDDLILPEDITSLNREEGVTFGKASQEDCNGTNNCNLIFKLTSEGLFKSDNKTSLPAENTWTFIECPIPEASVSTVLTRNIFDLPRGIRDIESTELTDEKNASGDFFVIEYITDAGKKTIQYVNSAPFADKRVKSYLDYIIQVTTELESTGEMPPATCP